MTTVTLKNLSKTYDNAHEPAVRNLSMEILSGRITALLGPSGCGKTTALKMIAGLIPQSSGEILFDGTSVSSIPAERRGAVMVFQNHLLFPYMSVGDNVGFGLKMRGASMKTIRPKTADMLELVKLSGLANRRPQQLSGGQQQRVALARALIVEPEVLLLDEPLSNLDSHLRSEMRELISDIQRKLNITTIFVTHDQTEAIMMADEIALLFEGQLQQYDRPRRFYETPANERVARFFGGSNFINGFKRGCEVETTMGKFACLDQPIADGPVTVTIRPEHLKIGPLSDQQRHESNKQNQFEATIGSHIYLGTHIRFQLGAAEHAFEVVAEARLIDQFRDGDAVLLEFPPERMWLLNQ